MNKRNKIIVSIVGITIVLLALLGITYAYYLTRIEGNTNTNSISITTANLKLSYGDGNTEILTSDKLLMPGEFEGTKDFTVTNNGNASVTYGVILEDMINPLSRPEDMKMILSCSSNKADGGCSGLDEMNLPSTNEFLVENTIEVGETHTYELKLSYIEAGVDQSIDMGKTISGKVNIIDSHDTVDMTGVVANYEEGDYVQVNSEPKISYITNDGKYKVVGLRPEQHTVAVYKSDGTLKGDTELTIKSGTTESISENEITITKDTRTIRMNVTAINDDSTITTGSAALDKYNPFESGTLAYEILNNANNVTEEDMLAGKAKYMDTPLTIPAKENNKYIYGDGGSSSETKETKYDESYAATSTNYFTYADSYEIIEECYEYEDEEGYYDECYYVDIYYTLKNTDGSPVSTVQGFSDLAGKYIVDYSGSTDSSTPDTNNLYYIYYVTRVDEENIYYIELAYGMELDLGYDKYLTYADSYTFNAKTGKYTLNNSDGSPVTTAKYADSYGMLEGKYVVSTYGYNSSDVRNYKELTYIYRVAHNDDKFSLKYYELKKKDVSIENILTKAADDYGTSYYFRGAINNNYLNYAGMCWRIMRIEGDDSIKLILEDQYAECDSLSYTGNWDLGKSNFGLDAVNYDKNSKPYYKLNYVDPVSTPSTGVVLKYKNFQNNKLNNYLDYLKREDWCFDDSAYADIEGKIKLDNSINDNTNELSPLYYFYNNIRFYYGPSVRTNLKQATLKCSGTILNNYKDGTDMLVGAVTIDELFYAGRATSSYEGYTYYIYNDYHKNNGGMFVTLSPGGFFTNYDSRMGMPTAYKAGSSIYSEYAHFGGVFPGFGDYTIVNHKHLTRPLVVLKEGIKYVSGDGSISNPYEVSL